MTKIHLRAPAAAAACMHSVCQCLSVSSVVSIFAAWARPWAPVYGPHQSTARANKANKAAAKWNAAGIAAHTRVFTCIVAHLDERPATRQREDMDTVRPQAIYDQKVASV